MGGIVALACLGVPSVAHASLRGVGPRAAAATVAVSPDSLLQIGIFAAALLILAILWWKDVIRPGSLGRPGGRGGKRDPIALNPAVWLLCAAIVYIAQYVGASLLLSLLPGAGASLGSIRSEVLLAISGYAASISCAFLLSYLVAARAPNAGVRFHWKDIAVGAGAALMIIPIVFAVGSVASWVYTLVHGSPPAEIAHSLLLQINTNRSDPWTYGLIAAAVVGAPIHEEFVFRVFLQSAFVCVFLHRWGAVIGTGILFALVHRLGPEPVPWHAIAPIFVLGISAGVAYERTGRPGVPMTIHAIFNALNVALVLFGLAGS